MEFALSLSLTTLLFASMFKILPDVLLSWRDVLVGAFITAILFTVGRFLIALYLAYSATASAYAQHISYSKTLLLSVLQQFKRVSLQLA